MTIGQITVFLADDNVLVREGVRARLNIEADLEVVGVAADYDELVQGADATKPQVVVTDNPSETEAAVYFCVADTGAGFAPAVSADGHGFVNMRDRLGAVGSTLVVDSAPGSGTRIGGHIPPDHEP